MQEPRLQRSRSGSPAPIRIPGIEFNITEHCNLACYGCDHASPLLPKRFALIKDFVRDFEALGSVLHAGELRLVGGEPLLHPGLPEFLRQGRRIGIADRIVLYTNGVLLHTAPDAVWSSIDELYISAYPGVRRRLTEEECMRRCAQHDVKLTIDRVEVFSRSLLNQPISDTRLRQAVFDNCRVAAECPAVHDGRFYRCAIAPFIGARLGRKSIAFDNRREDGVPLHNNPGLRAAITACLTGRQALKACTWCLGSSAPYAQHHQLNHEGCRAWLAEDTRSTVDEVRDALLGPPGLARRIARKFRRRTQM
jgi:organic radical activating enzyme